VRKKKLITYGTFDMFHIGHLKLLERLSKLADEVIVAVSTDEFNKLKNKKVVIPYEQRAEIVSSIKYVSKVIPERNWEQKIEDIKTLEIDIFAIGDDWAGHFDFLQEYVDVIYLPRTENISTTDLKALVANFRSDKVQELKNTVDQLSLIVANLI
jgi:glycerol-3-phosphate cytidylyltransferase